MAEAMTIDFSKPVPLFPLVNCALLPHAVVPLHIFEPRYRAMVAEALDSSGLVAMAVFDGDEWKTNYKGAPAVREHVCVGYLARHEKLPDGRYNVLLQGLCRARIVRELDHEPYRTAMLEPTETEAAMEIDLEEPRKQIEALLEDPLLKQLASVQAIENWLSKDVPTSAVVDLTVLMLCPMVEPRYRILAQPDVLERAEWLERYLRGTRRTLQMADKQGPALSEEGLSLN